MTYGPDPNAVYPNEAIRQVCYIKNVITRPNIQVGGIHVLRRYRRPGNFSGPCDSSLRIPGDRLIIGKFCAIARSGD